MTAALRLAFGTLTILPVRPPAALTPRVAGWAMALAPLPGAALALALGLGLWLLGWGAFPPRPASPVLAAALVLAASAWLTRAIHLDGLADTADGLGSGLSGDPALAVMRRGDIGPFGVVTLATVLLVEFAALWQHLDEGDGVRTLSVGLVASRLVLPVLCLRGIPAARQNGLGRAVAGSVTGPQLVAAVALAGVVLTALAGLPAGLAAGDEAAAGPMAATVALAVVAGTGLAWRCVRRFGGITGDVLGACVEVAFAASLVVPALL